MDNKHKQTFNWRGFVSVTTALAFLGVTITGCVLFVIPPGRIANWNNWQLWGLSKQQWNGLHIWFSLLFLITSVAHIVYNWKCLVRYFKDKTRRHLALRWEWVIAALLVWVVSVGTVRELVPFSSFLDWHRTIKHRDDQSPPESTAEENDSTEPMPETPGRGFGRMTLTQYCQQQELEVTAACDTLIQAGMMAEPDMTLWEIVDTVQGHPSDIRRLLEN